MSCLLNTKLYNQLDNYYSSTKKVDEVVSVIFTPEFKNKFGDWENIQDINEFSGRIDSDGYPFLNFNSKKFPYFIDKNNNKFFLDNRVLNFSHEVIEALLESAMFQLFYDNIASKKDVLEDVNVNSLLTNKEGSIYKMLNGNKKDIQDVMSLVVDKLRQFNVKVTEPENEEYINEPEAVTNNRLGEKASFENNNKDNATANMKFFLSFIPEMENVNGQVQPKIKTVKNNDGTELIFFSFVPFDQIWNRMQDSLADSIDFYENDGTVKNSLLQSMLEKLLNDFPNDATVEYIVNTVLEMPDYKQTEFVQAFNNHKVKFLTSLINKANNLFSFKFFRSDSAVNPKKIISKEWKESVKRSKLFSIVDGKYIFNEDKKNKFVTSYDNFLAKVRNSKDVDINPTHVADFQKLLKFLNINVTPETLALYIERNTKDDQTPNEGFINTVDKFGFVVKDIRNLNDKSIVENVIKEVYTKLGSPQLEILADIEKDYRKSLSENTVMGAEGKKFWIYSMRSYLSNKVKRITKDINEDGTNNAFLNGELPAKKGFFTNSIWLDMLSKPDENKEFIENFDILTFNNYREENAGDEGSSNKDMNPADQLTDQMNKALYKVKNDPAMKQSVYYTPTPADKGTMHHIIGAPFFQNLFTGYNENGDIKVTEATVDIFIGYVLDEIKRAEEEYKKLSDVETFATQLYKDMHWVEDKETGKPVFFNAEGVPIGNAFKITLLPELNMFSPSPLFNGIFKDGQLIKSDEEFRNLDSVRNAVSKALSDSIFYVKTDMQDMGLISNDKLLSIDNDIERVYSNRYNQNEQHILDAIISDFTLNQMISNIEYNKVFFGDWAQAKNLIDLSKRYPGSYSTGTHLALREGDPADFTLSVGPNIIVPSKAIDEMMAYSPAMAKAFSKINSTDAQGWITLDRWKFVMERSNHWNPKFEAAYQRFKTNTQTSEDYKFAAQPMKSSHFQTVDGKVTMVKYSAAPLIPLVVKDTPLGTLLDSMIEQGVDEYVVIDGIKLGAVVPSDVVDAEGNIKSESKELDKLISQLGIVYLDENDQPCAANGLTNATKGTNWKMVKDFKGMPSHSQGGVDISISDKGVSMRRGNSDIKAAYGLLIINK